MPLGRGLGALIPPRIIKKITEETLAQTGERVLEIPVDEIEPNPAQPRKNFSHEEMEELANSIRTYGIIQPLILTQITSLQGGEKGIKYQLVAGERRWRAAKILSLTSVPAIIRKVKDIEKLELTLVENIQRKDLNPMERARAFQRLISEFNLTQEEVARKIGKARATVANTLRLLNLPESVQGAIEEEKISEGHAKALLAVETPEKQKALLKRILGLGLTVRETEKMVSGRRIRKSIELDPRLLEKERELSEILGTRVKIRKMRRGGKITIETYSREELEGMIEKLLNYT